MKKRIWMMLLAAGCLALTACGEDKKVSDETVSEESDTEETAEEKDTTPVTDKTIEAEGIEYFMALGEYKGISLTKTLYEVTDTDVENEILYELAYAPLEVTDPEATVAVGDVVNIAFEGSIDGELFEGGSSDSYDLTIGSGSFIDDFEDQLVGLKTGETEEVNATFPDDYWSEDLQGKEAVFVVTINSISRILEEPTAEWLAANTSYTTVDEYREGVKYYLEQSNATTSENNLWDDAWTAVFSTARFNEYPQDVLDECLEQQKLSYESYAAMYGMTYDDFMEATGITEDDLLEASKNTVQQALTIEYICSKEGITEDSDTYQEKLSELLENSGYADVDTAIEDGVPEWNIRFVTKYHCVINFILDNAVITEETVTTE